MRGVGGLLRVIYDALKKKPAILNATFEIEYPVYYERASTNYNKTRYPRQFMTQKKPGCSIITHNLAITYFLVIHNLITIYLSLNL